jgi:RimJ/RimL family protein N-acetyltransferase
MSPSVPLLLRSARLLLRPWRAEDAPSLSPILEANQAHLSPWIPPHVWRPAPIPALVERLAGFAAAFADDREWRYGLFGLDDSRLLGEVALFPRAASGRVPFAEADHVEIGYWLRADATGAGLATEAAQAALGIAAALPGLSHVEIRCDPRNVPSAAVPRRLGFDLSRTIEQTATASGSSSSLQVWTLELPVPTSGD